MTALPSYAELPIDASRPPGSAWGVFGDDDEAGTINLLTPERVLRGISLVKDGAVFSLNWELDRPDPPILGRGALHHTVIDLDPGTDDRYDGFYPQVSSQWDALCHMAHPEHGFYNGRTREQITGERGSVNGIDHWARSGIVGRFVLADVERWRREQGDPIRQDAKDEITVDQIDATLASQGVELETGDILLLRTGWIGWYESVSQEVRRSLSAMPVPGMPSPGLSAAPETDPWLWDRHLAVIACDCPALEALPYQESVEGFLHWRMIPLLGLAVGEMFVLDALAEHCARDGRYDGLFTAAPLNKPGGSGSTANALAIK
jgi:kynurenine formamidase